MEGTRRRLLALLQRMQPATVRALADALDLAPATVRRHLDILQRDRLVDYHLLRQRTGRPEHAYYLTEAGQEALPKAYHHLLQHLLQELDQLLGSSRQGDVLDCLFRRIAAHMARPYAHGPGDRPPAERLAALQQVLTAQHFAPELEPTREGLRIHLLNCPFRSVALHHEAICTLDQHLIATVLGVPITKTQCINQGHHHCTYVASLPSTATPAQ